MRAILAAVVLAGITTAAPRVLVKLDPSTGSTARDGRLILIPPDGPEPAEDSGCQVYQDWTSKRLPQMLLVATSHATREKQFRGIGEPWACVVFGGSTGGWMTLAQQIFYPDYFGGAWGLCPDPVDFHAFRTIHLYEDKNACYDEGPFQRFPKLGARLPNDHILFTMESLGRQEAVLGMRGRFGGQMDAFNATFGPTDADGYPDKLWDAGGGAISESAPKNADLSWR